MHLATIFTLAPVYARPVWHSAVRVGVPVCGSKFSGGGKGKDDTRSAVRNTF
jgi:hypothetical protein